MENINALEGRIRDFINSGRRQYNLLQSSATWNKLCSSLDLIGDTQVAIDSYSQIVNTEGIGASYLIVYGILQTLLLQQDAARHIGEALGIKLKLPKNLEEIRVIRNSAAGHPAHQMENGLSKSCFITRNSISPTGFDLTTVYSGDKEYKMSYVSIPFLLETQHIYIREMLSKIVTELEKQEMEHREMYKAKKLIDIFPQTIGYHFGKIYEATDNKNIFSLGILSLKIIFQCIDEFKNELSRRNEWEGYEAIHYLYELIDYPLNRLEAYFNCDDSMNEKDAYIFASFLSNQLNLLQEIARDLDEEYESTP